MSKMALDPLLELKLCCKLMITNELSTDNEELNIITQVPTDIHFLLYPSILVNYSRF